VNNAEFAAVLAEAHAAKDHAALVQIYTQIADAAEIAGDTDTACFFLTQAFVFALEVGAKDVEQLETRLRQYGRVD